MPFRLKGFAVPIQSGAGWYFPRKTILLPNCSLNSHDLVGGKEASRTNDYWVMNEVLFN